MRIFKNKWFGRFAHKENIGDDVLCDAIDRAGKGLIDADLGGGLIKQRVARTGMGRSGGFRTIVVYRPDDKAIFVFGFSKSGKASLDRAELAVFKSVAGFLLKLNERELAKLISLGELQEVKCDG